MLLINVFIKQLMKKVKNTNNFTPIPDILFSDWHVIKYSYKYFSLYINIIVIMSKFSSQQKHFNLMWIIHIYTGVFSFHLPIRLSQETKLSKQKQMKVFLQTDFRLKVLRKYCIRA